MMSFIHWLSATRRLESCETTIAMMGGSRVHDEDIPPQLAAQRDMIKFEIKFYKEKSIKFFWGSLIALYIGMIVYFFIFM